MSDPNTLLERGVDGGAFLERVLRELGNLAPNRATAIVLHLIQGYTLAETAEIMGKKPAAAKMAVHRGVRDLRRRLPPEWREAY